MTTNKNKKTRLYGFDVSVFDTTTLFILLSIAHIAFSVIFAFFQEKVTTVKGFKQYASCMTLIQTPTYAICALIEMLLSKGDQGDVLKPRAPLLNYGLLSILTVGGMYTTNKGLNYISYPLRIIFKAAKPVPTMILEYLYVGKIFKREEILSVGLLTCGIIVFCYGEASGAATFDSLGILFMVLGVTFDAFTSNYEKKNIFNHNASHCEAMFWASLFGTFTSYVGVLLYETDSFLSFWNFIGANSTILFWLFLSSVGGYMSVSFILLLIKLYSTTYAECVKGTRKVVSIAISYIFISSGKSFGNLHALGIMFFVGSILITIYNKSKRKTRKDSTESETEKLMSDTDKKRLSPKINKKLDKKQRRRKI